MQTDRVTVARLGQDQPRPAPLGRMLARGLIWLSVLVAAGCAHSPSYDPQDPLERINRPVFAFNRQADRYLVRPVAQTYVKVVPTVARTGVHNFFDNLFYPTTIVNDLLQGKLRQTGSDGLRFLMNSTIGLAGLLDVASGQGLSRHDEDLGQTFGSWGVGQGWYLMLPLLGPSTNRDLLGAIGDNWTDLLQYWPDNLALIDRLAIAGGKAIDHRAGLLGADSMLDQQLDPYVFIRSAYLAHRRDEVYDGHAPPEEGLDDEPSP